MLDSRIPRQRLLGARLAFKAWGPVVLSIHVFFGGLLRKVFLGAGLAGKTTGPMVPSIHVFIGSLLGKVFLGTSLAREARGPMVGIIHVLLAGPLGTERAVASLTVVAGAQWSVSSMCCSLARWVRNLRLQVSHSKRSEHVSQMYILGSGD